MQTAPAPSLVLPNCTRGQIDAWCFDITLNPHAAAARASWCLHASTERAVCMPPCKHALLQVCPAFPCLALSCRRLQRARGLLAAACVEAPAYAPTAPATDTAHATGTPCGWTGTTHHSFHALQTKNCKKPMGAGVLGVKPGGHTVHSTQANL